MSAHRRRVLIGVPTSGRQEGLARLLAALAAVAEPADGVEVAVAVVDNEPSERTRRLVERAASGRHTRFSYLVEPEPGIPFARNACVQAALDGDVDALIFIDDDEWPAAGWLEALLDTWDRTGADIVVGPATAVLPPHAPGWARHSAVFDKDRQLPNGTPVRTAYSYNTLISRHALETLGPAFDPAFRHTGSSDHHYFKQAAAAGLHSVWASEALVYEQVEPHRARLRWVLKRGYRIGAGATRSTCLRLGRVRGAGRIAVLVPANLAYAAWQMLRSAGCRGAWVEGLRRSAIAVGLLGGTIHRYEEYTRGRHRS